MFRLSVRFSLFAMLIASAFAVAAPPPSPSPQPSGVFAFWPVATATDAPASAPMPREKSDDLLCCGLELVGQDELPADGPKLGRVPPKEQYDVGNFRAVVGTDGKTRYFPRLTKHANYKLRSSPIPSAINYGIKALLTLKKMYLNDKYGCCVISSRAHQFGIVHVNELGTEVFASDQEILTTYKSFCGGGDNGCNMSAVNELQQTRGMSIGGKVRKIEGFASVDNTNVDLVKTAITVFGGLNVGHMLPQDWYSSKDGSDWGPTNSRIVGGHEVQAYGYDEKGVWISTWGGTRRILWDAFTSRKWVDEVYVALLPEWYAQDGVSAAGFDVKGLRAALAELSEGKIPVLPGPQPPVVVPPVVVPPVVTPPTPGTGFTGSLIFKNGVLVGGITGDVPVPVNPPVVTPPVVTPPGPGGANPALEELKNRIAKAQARKDGAGIIVTRAELAAARAKIESALTDEALTQLAIEKKIPVVGANNKAGALSDFFEWIIAHQAEIAAFIEFIIKIISGIALNDLHHKPSIASPVEWALTT